MNKFFSIINKVLTILVIITMTGQNVVQAQPPQQDGKPRIDYSDSTGKVVFIGADANAPIVVRAAKAPGLNRSESALAMVSQYETDFGLRDAETELQLLSENQVGSRNVTRFQQVYQGIPVIAGEMVVNATDSAGLLSLSGEIAPDLNISTKPSITSQQAMQTATEFMRKVYTLTAAEITFTTPELWIYDSRLLQPDGTAPALVWRIEAQAQNNLSVNEFILIDATRGHIALNFNQVDTAWNEAETGKVENEDTPQTVTPTPTPIVPTATPEAPQTPTSDASTLQNDSQPIPTPVEKPETDQPDKAAPQPQLGITYYVDIAMGNNSNSCTAPASPCKDIQETINKAGSGDIIRIASGVYTKSTNPSPNVVIINGKNLTLSGGWNSGFTTQSGVSTIDGQNVNNGYLHLSGTVTIENFIIQNSTSSDSGAIYIAGGTLTLKRSTLKNNYASNRGGGIFMINGNLTVENSTISGNTALSSGAGMYLVDGLFGTVTIKNSTISNNATIGGGSSGGGITQANSAWITLTNSIVANNTASSNPDCNGTLGSASYNIIENASGCTITSGSNNSNVDPLLSVSLSGTFQVHTPQTGSPAINGGTNTGCPSVDQLGYLRPQGVSCDMGAVEVGAKSIVIQSGTGQSAAINTVYGQQLSVFVHNENYEPVSGVEVSFSAPNSGPSVSFTSSNTSTATATTDINGIATPSTFTANGLGGTVVVTASAPGYSSINFQLFNRSGLWYVATTGNISNSCMSPSSPCPSFPSVLNNPYFTDGDEIRISGGTYSNYINNINKSVILSGGWNTLFTSQNAFTDITDKITISSNIAVTIRDLNIKYANGAINNSGDLTLERITISNNRNSSDGGGIYQNNGNLNLINVTISNNRTGGNAGPSVIVSGGGIHINGGTVSIKNSTITQNIAIDTEVNQDATGGGIANPFNRPVTITNSIIAGNIAANGTDCFGNITSSGHNFWGSSSGCTISSQASDIYSTQTNNASLKLGNLQNNGGVTNTHALLTGSAAIDAANLSQCPVLDQRGVNRPQGANCDIGAYEGAANQSVTGIIQTYTVSNNNVPGMPGQIACADTASSCEFFYSYNQDVVKAHTYSIGVYNYYLNKHGRFSFDNNNSPIISTVDYLTNFQNAFWSGTQMVYGDGYPLADDVVAHELTHGVTQYESNLFYYYQSGAINESFSDVWGELYDQENGLGNDSPSAKWLLGEDLPSGAIRSMSNPPTYSDPDKMTSTYYDTTSSDNGGVHTNSGINNKAVYLMVDGGTFNGRTVTALGANKTLAIYYEVQTNLLSSGADYGDLYNLLYQACLNLVNGPDGITNANCQEVRDATDAVEMNLQPVANFNTDAPLCAPSKYVVTTYQDGFESGLGSWSINNGATPRWQLDSPYGPFAHSGSHFLYGNDYPQTGAVTNATATWSSKLIPAGAYLHFAHAYDFETSLYSNIYYDGGVLEYSTNGGSTWIDAGSLIDYNGYKGAIFSAYNNPLAGKSAFVGTSHGYISTRVNLTSLAGQNVSFRWRMGLDDSVAFWGWWLDDVQIYTCGNGPTISGSTGISGVVLSYTDGAPKMVTSDANGNYSFTVPSGWSGTVTPSHACYTFSPASYSYTNVTIAQPNKNYAPTFISVNNCADINIGIGGTNQGTYTLSPGTSQVLKYALDGGPVVIGSGNGTDIIASLNQWRRRPSTTVGWTGVAQTMALPVSQITNAYYFPRYDYSSPSALYNNLLIANVDTVSRDITITIGGVVRGTYTLGPSQSQYVNYPGVVGGPVVVSSVSGAKIVASLYELIRDPSLPGWNGQSEMIGLPATQLSDQYLIPLYFGAANPNTLNASLYIANVTSGSTSVEIRIAGVLRGTYPLAANTGQVVKYALDGGPVEIRSTNGANIVASLNQWRRRPSTTVGWTGVAQTMALPVSLITDTYYFPRYDYSAPSALYNNLLIANVDTVSRDITITIGGVVRGTYTLAPSQSQYVNYPGLVGGPVVVSSVLGAKIVASLYELIRDPSAPGWNGQSEMMGLPASQLSDQYLIPLYFGAANPNTLNASLYIAVP